jgi:hypothetical protein
MQTVRKGAPMRRDDGEQAVEVVGDAVSEGTDARRELQLFGVGILARPERATSVRRFRLRAHRELPKVAVFGP